VNQLAEEIENHRQVSTKLREEIGKYVQGGNLGRARASD
jgi:hypothetical protein